MGLATYGYFHTFNLQHLHFISLYLAKQKLQNSKNIKSFNLRNSFLFYISIIFTVFIYPCASYPTEASYLQSSLSECFIFIISSSSDVVISLYVTVIVWLLYVLFFVIILSRYLERKILLCVPCKLLKLLLNSVTSNSAFSFLICYMIVDKKPPLIFSAVSNWLSALLLNATKHQIPTPTGITNINTIIRI